eukprot:14067430-Alexandrium_andersonii.AAC.1
MSASLVGSEMCIRDRGSEARDQGDGGGHERGEHWGQTSLDWWDCSAKRGSRVATPIFRKSAMQSALVRPARSSGVLPTKFFT